MSNLIKNIGYLTVLQALNYLLPVIQIPLVTQAIGLEKFGYANYLLAISVYICLVTDWGFNLSATKSISLYRDDKTKVNKIFNCVILSKLFIFFIILLLSYIVFLIFGFDFKDIYLLFLLYIIGNLIYPLWLYQGLEKMKLITIITAFVRLFYLLLIYIFIKDETDFNSYVLILTTQSLFLGLIAITFAVYDFKLVFEFPKFKEILKTISKSSYLFYSNISAALYANSIPVLLGLLTNNQIVGQFSIAEKVMKSIRGFFSPISQALYPYMSKLMSDDVDKGLVFLVRTSILTAFILGSLVLIIGYFSSDIVFLFIGYNDPYMEVLIEYYIWVPVLVSLSNILGVQGMLPLGLDKDFMKILIKGAILGVIILPLSIVYFSSLGAVISSIFIELIILSLMFKRLRNEFK